MVSRTTTSGSGAAGPRRRLLHPAATNAGTGGHAGGRAATDEVWCWNRPGDLLQPARLVVVGDGGGRHDFLLHFCFAGTTFNFCWNQLSMLLQIERMVVLSPHDFLLHQFLAGTSFDFCWIQHLTLLHRLGSGAATHGGCHVFRCIGVVLLEPAIVFVTTSCSRAGTGEVILFATFGDGAFLLEP